MISVYLFLFSNRVLYGYILYTSVFLVVRVLWSWESRESWILNLESARLLRECCVCESDNNKFSFLWRIRTRTRVMLRKLPVSTAAEWWRYTRCQHQSSTLCWLFEVAQNLVNQMDLNHERRAQLFLQPTWTSHPSLQHPRLPGIKN